MELSKVKIEKLILRCKEDDRNAQKEIYQMFSPSLLGVIYRYVPDYDTANEVLQLTFIKMFKQIDTFSGDHFDRWLCKIAINTALNTIKKNKKYDQMVDINDTSISEKIEGHSYDVNVMKDILNIITILPQEERTLFNLRAIDGYSFKEIAQMVQLTEPNCRVKYHRVRAKLAKLVEHIL